MSKCILLSGLILLGAWGCAPSNQVALEFRLADEEASPGLEEMVFQPTGERVYLHREVLLNQADVDSAAAVWRDDRWEVELFFTLEGARKFAELTEQNLGGRCGMVLDGQLLSAPRIMAPIKSGRALITSDFTEAEARRIAQGLTQP